MERKYYVGVDIGGTFTDVVVSEASGERLYNAKTLTTPANPVQGVMTGIKDALGLAQAQPQQVSRVVHATTLATNLIIERKGAALVFLTTKGFGDMFALGKQVRLDADCYNLLYERPPALVPRKMVFEVTERLTAEGEVLVPLDETDAAATLKEIAVLGPQSVAVCLLHSFANPVHERRLAEMLRNYLPNVYVALSSEIWPEIGEYERAATTVISAYVGPMFSQYVRNLSEALKQSGIKSGLEIMQSSGGIMPAATAARKAVYSIESGPAAGVIAASHLGQLCAQQNIISFDMGGTTAKVALVPDGKPGITHDFRIGTMMSGGTRKGGEPVKVPVIDLAEVGAGGGSIAWVDSAGFLHVGPESAGADPGPACYGFGGERPTVTDADVVLGYLDPEYFLGGKMRIFPEKSRQAIARAVAEPLKLSIVEAAKGIYDLINAKMGSAIRVVTVRRGVDPRGFATVAFGGAGPVHILKVAEQFEIPLVIVPLSPGVKSAFGLLVSDMAYDYITTQLVNCKDADTEQISEIVAAMEHDARSELRSQGVSDDAIVLQRFFDMRFVHQRHEMAIPVPRGAITQNTVFAADQEFRRMYSDMFGVRPDDPSQIVNFRIRAVGMVPKLQLLKAPAGNGNPERALKKLRKAYFPEAGGFVETPVYDRASLENGDRVEGPAIIEEPDSTTICPPGYSTKVDPFLSLLISRTVIS
ncbi:MAG: hydantoinase/oxoprolinase family protein [Candidatus Binataceae bacterium]